MGAAHAAQQLTVNLPYQPNRNGQFVKPGQPGVHSAYVVDYFASAFPSFRSKDARLRFQHILEGALRAFD